MEVPDFTSQEVPLAVSRQVCDHVRKWDRDFNSIASIKVKRVKEGHLEAALADKPAVPAEDKEME